MRQVDNFELSP